MLIRCEGYSCSSWGRTVHSFAEKKKTYLCSQLNFFKTDDIASSHIPFDGGFTPPPPADSIWRMFMLLVRGEPFTFYCGGGGLKNCWSKVTAPKSKDSFIIFFYEKNDNSTQLFLYEWRRLALSRHVVIGKVLPSVPSQDNAEGYISRNEMSSDYVNVSFFKWKGFHGTFIEQGNSLHVAANIINETNVSG